jgi:protein phosphatase
VIRGESDLMAACKALIDRANANGGPDNITVIVARFEGAGLRDPNDTDEVGHRVFPLPETGQTPAMAMDRIIDTGSPTQPVEAVPRPRATTTMTPESDAAKRDSERRKTVPIAPDAGLIPEVSPSRRSAGRLIAIALLAILILGAAWFAITITRPKADSTATGGAPGAPRH